MPKELTFRVSIRDTVSFFTGDTQGMADLKR